MPEDLQNITFALYARKSTESEDRQALSIPAQLSEVEKNAKRYGINILEKNIIQESKSAKLSFKRPEFNRLIEEIKKGHIQGVVAWHPDRLARNAIDAARLVELFDEGKLKVIVTQSQIYLNTPNDKFFLTFQCGAAKMENDKKGIDVARGLRQKAEMGIYPNQTPIGYKNVVRGGMKVIEVDPDVFPILGRVKDAILEGVLRPMEIFKKVNEEWGYKAIARKPMGRSTFYNFLSRPFYYGDFEYPMGSGNWQHGTHMPLMTREEYDKIQFILGRAGRPRPKHHVFIYSGLIKCGECGASITTEEKIKRQQNGNVHQYVYYHCTKRVNPDCSQGSVEQKSLEKQIQARIEEISIPPEFHSFAMKWLGKELKKESVQRQKTTSVQTRRYQEVTRTLENLIEMRANGEISAEELAQMKANLIPEKARIEEEMRGTGESINEWLEKADRVFEFAETAKDKFENGTLETKRYILTTLGSNLVLKDKILSIDINKSLFPLQIIGKETRQFADMLEPLNNVVKQERFEQMCLESPRVLRD